MPSSYTPLLRLTLPADGELVGTWGQTVNNGITTLEEASIAGTATIAMADANRTLSTANGAADEARAATLNVTGALTAQRDVICPSVSKNYFVRNNTTGGFGVQVKTAAGTGIVVPAGGSMLVYCDGVNVVQAVAGGTGYFADGTAALPSIAFAADHSTGIWRGVPGELEFSVIGAARMHLTSSALKPGSIQAISLGGPGQEWATVYAGSGGVDSIGNVLTQASFAVNGPENGNISGQRGHSLFFANDTLTVGGGNDIVWQTGGAVAQKWAAIGAHLTSNSGSAASGDLDFYTGSGAGLTLRMRIDALGNVGIGTDVPANYGAPYRSMTLGGASVAGVLVITEPSAEGLAVYPAGNDMRFVVNGAKSFSFRAGSAGNEHLRVDASGTVSVVWDAVLPARRRGSRFANNVSSGTTGNYSVVVNSYPHAGEGAAEGYSRLFFVTLMSSGLNHHVIGAALYGTNWDASAILLTQFGQQNIGGSVTFGVSGLYPLVSVANIAGGVPSYIIDVCYLN